MNLPITATRTSPTLSASLSSVTTVSPPAREPTRLRRAECYAFDNFLLDTGAETLLRDGKPVLLGTRSMKLLLALVEHRDRVVGKEELLSLAWPRFTVVENNLAVAVFALRRALDDRPYIRSVYGQGYRFVGPITVSARQLGAAPRRTADLPSIAVLPFTAAADGEGTMLGEGIAEDIRSELSRNRWLTVIARSSSCFGTGPTPGPGQAYNVADQLDVRYVVEGTIRRAGGRVRVTAHLSDAAAGIHLLSERYERPLTDLFDLQDEITAQIVAAVRPVLGEAEEQRALRQHPSSIDAWTAYQRGLWHLARYGDDDIGEARAMFGRAIDIDRRYAPGYHGTARLYLHVGSGHRSIMPADWQARGEQFAQRALELDSRDSEAHGMLALARHLRGDHAGALATVDVALQLNPNDAMAHSTRGAALIFGGRPEEGIGSIQTCIRLSPRDVRLNTRHMHIGLGLFLGGDYRAAEAHAAHMVNRWPSYGPAHRLMAMVLGQTGQVARAQPFLRAAIDLEPSFFDRALMTSKPWYRPADLRAALQALERAGWKGT